jgi:Uma2 family endonuclease
MKVRILDRNCFYYPDVMVTCNPQDQTTPTYKQFPKLIVEVLSNSTEAFDRGDRFADYQTLESLEEYVLINTRHQRIECFRRDSGGRWLLQTYTETTPRFELQSVDFADSLATIYEDVILESTPPGERSF